MKKAQTTLIKRAIYAVAIFLIPTIIILVIQLVDPDNPAIDCWNNRVNSRATAVVDTVERNDSRFL